MWYRLALPVVAFLLVLANSGCAHRGKAAPRISRLPPAPAPPSPSAGRPTPAPPTIAQGQEGIATWYGRPYHGRRTASGEVYNMYGISAAHRTLPFGTRVRVHNLKNGRTVEVRINDRGPFVEGRIIDLSYAAAQAISMPGSAPVRLEILGLEPATPPAPPQGSFAVQVGAFGERANAERLRDSMATRFGQASIEPSEHEGGVIYRVRVGRESSEQNALELARKIREAGLAEETFVVRVD